ncbi:DUF6009 family protein [Streptomyces microflavus]|uniref:DUF6009 family protein n=1 Tax=Streptomyces microflavus TaxID=1919 RepID=UPI0036EE16F9
MASTSNANSAPRSGLRPRSPRRLRQGREVRTRSERIRPSSSTGRKTRRLTGTTDCGTGPDILQPHDPLPPRRPHGRLRRPRAEAGAAPDSGFQNRRLFYLLPHDRDAEPHRLHRAGVPGEAVDSRTIRPGQVGGRTAPL